MRNTLVALYGLLWGVWLWAAVPVAVPAQVVDHRIYAELLKAHVVDSRVDYAGIQRDEARLDRYLSQLAAIKPDSLNRDAQFAFYINAYNAWTIKLILSEYPDIDSIKDIGGFFSGPWDQRICRIDGRQLSLGEIEHDILRPRFKDPRVHFAINCASRSCPPLRAEPFEGHRLDVQLDDATRSFLNQPQNTFVKNDRLYVSRIFKWFRADFDRDVIGFILKFAQGELKAAIAADREHLRLVYLEYDWSLNDV